MKMEGLLQLLPSCGWRSAINDSFHTHASSDWFLQGLDVVLDKLKSLQFPFERVAGISSSGQQHGSVYWRKGSEEVLKSLEPSQSLASQLQVRNEI